MIEDLGIRLSAEGVVQATNGVNLTGKAIEDLGKKADAAAPAIARTGKTTKETAAAMRLLPAQITDITTSLASGQAAWLVAIQQGGQIKDSFGGIAPTFNVLRAAINPVALAIGTATAAAGALVVAQQAGQREAQGYSRAIVMTGNAAGTTSDQMSDMARAVDGVVGTQRQAADALTQLAASGRVGRNELQQFTEVAVRMERTVGQSVEDTVKVFADLARAPLQASIRLNETTNFLTKSTYDHIKALVEQKRMTEAGAVAQQAYADAMTPRLATLEGNVGTLQRAWRGLGAFASEAWDAMLGLGREQTATQKIKAVQDQLEALDTRKSQNPALTAQRKAVLQEQLAALQEVERMSRRSAERQGANAAGVRDAIAAAESAKNKAAGASEKAEPPVWFDTLDALDGRLKLLNAEMLKVNPLQGIDDEARKRLEAWRAKNEETLDALEKRDAEYLQGLLDANRRAGIELMSDEQARGQALIAMDRDIALRRMAAMGLTGSTADQARSAIETSSALARRKLEEGEATRRTETIRASIEEGLLEGFRGGGRIADVFLREVKAQFLSTVFKVPIQFMAQGGADLLGLLGGGLKSLMGMGGGGFGTGAAFGNQDLGLFFHGGGSGAGEATFRRSLPASTWAGAPRFHSGIGPGELPAIIKDDESVLTKGQMRQLAPVSATSGKTVHVNYAPVFNVDSRSDRAEIMSLMDRRARAAQADLLEKLSRNQA